MISRYLIVISSVAFAGCSTHADLLEMRRDQLLRLESAATAINAQASAGEFDPASYDLYLMLNRTLFEQTLGAFEGRSVTVQAGNRPIRITLPKLEMAFRPGASELTIDAVARDLNSGIEAEVYMDVRLVIEGDPSKPDDLFLRLSATRLVPRIAWGPFDFTERRFVRDLLSLEAIRFTERLPRMTLPLRNEFAMGDEGGTRPSGQISTGDGWFSGTVTHPSTRIEGQVTVRRILFLGNGVHLFANVEGM